MKICCTRAVWEHSGSRIRSIVPDADFAILEPDARFSTVGGGSEPVEADRSNVDLVFLSEDLYRATRATVAASVRVAMSGVDWVHSSSAGIDHPMFAAMLKSGATLTHAPGQHSRPMAEYVLGQMLRHAKHMSAHAEAQRDHAWRPVDSEELTGKTIGIVGYGGIGAAVAKLARAFDMRVIATKRHSVEDPNLDGRLTPERLPELLADSDYVVVTVPLTDETRGLIDRPQLARMKPSALLINVARGGIVDERALVAALRAGRLAGAVLDVTEQEPLPSDSPLWDIPNLVITPHDSGDSPFGFTRTVDGWLRNLTRYVRAEPLEGVATSTGLSEDSARRRELGQA